MNRQQQVSNAFVGLANTLADDFDPLTLFQRLVGHCIDLIDGVAGAGVLMNDGRGELRVMAASSEEAGLLELLQQQSLSGPCVDCYRAGRPIDAPDLRLERERWPLLVPAALDAGYHSVHTVPLRVDDRPIGALNLFGTRAERLSEDDRHLVQALADVTALALIHWADEPVRPADVLTRLQSALSAKATLEMAKGIVAEYADVSIAEAAALLRLYTVNQQARLTDTVTALTRRTLHPSEIVRHHPADTPGNPR